MNIPFLQKFDLTIEERIESLKKTHLTKYGPGKEIVLSYASGRAEILGNHTDYNQGYSLSANVTRSLLLAASPRDDKTVRIASLNQESAAEFSVESESSVLKQKSRPGSTEAWSNYVKGVIWSFLKEGHTISGFDAVIGSSIPQGGGMSSSAAIETAVARLLCHRDKLPVTPWQQVELCKRAENTYAGVPCGYLDQATVGLASEMLFISYKPEGGHDFSYHSLELELAKHELCFVAGFDPESMHSLTDGKYAKRQKICFDSLDVLSRVLNRPVASLREVKNSELELNSEVIAKRLDKNALKFVTHVVSENERVLDAAAAVKTGSLAAFGKLMTESGYSAINNYELDEDAPELRFVYETVLGKADTLGILGIRNMGGGFNATTLALARKPALQEYKDTLSEVYMRTYGRPYSFIDFVPAPAAAVIN